MEEIKTVGEPFDFKLHDCMFTEQSMEYAEDIVTRVCPSVNEDACAWRD